MAVFNGSNVVNDSSTGGAGDDVVNGLALNDTLDGGTGASTP
jgi:Ca2+-binding RTX toxin-like protein